MNMNKFEKTISFRDDVLDLYNLLEEKLKIEMAMERILGVDKCTLNIGEHSVKVNTHRAMEMLQNELDLITKNVERKTNDVVNHTFEEDLS